MRFALLLWDTAMLEQIREFASKRLVRWAFVLFLGLRSWFSLANDEISRMRRSQVTDTAVIPAEPVRRSRA